MSDRLKMLEHKQRKDKEQINTAGKLSIPSMR